MSKKPQLHASALSMKCLEQFRRRYIENEIIPPGIAMIVGLATDASVTKNLKHKIQKKRLLPDQEIADVARDALVRAWDGGVKLDDEEALKGPEKVKGEATDKAIRLSLLHHQGLAPALDPVQVQRSWSLDLKMPVDLVGRIDIEETKSRIRDTKTSGKSPSQDAADKSVQLAAYALALATLDKVKLPIRVYLDFLVDIKNPAIKTVEAEKGKEHFTAILRRIETLVRAMEAGIFPPVEPDHWVCDPKWCGYWNSCKFTVHPKSVAI